MRRATILAVLLMTGCGPFQLDPVTPESAPDSVLGEMSVGSVDVSLAQGMEADQRQVMESERVAPEMQRVLTAAFQNAGGGGGGPATVNVTVTSIRYSAFGPTRMHTKTEVLDPDGSVVNSFENESMSMRSKALERVAQDMVQKIANNI